MKKDQYFNLEVNLLNNDDITGMMLEMNAAEALGIYMILLLHLRAKDDYEASCKPVLLEALARRYNVDERAMGRVLRDFGLFEVDEERQTFRSFYLDRVMRSLEEKRRISSENGKKGGRPKKVGESAETPASKGEKANENQKSREEESREEESRVKKSRVKESRVKESRVKESRVKKSESADSGLSDSGLSASGLSDSGLADSGLADSGLAASGLSDSRLAASRLSDSGLADSRLSDSRLSDSGLADSRLTKSRLEKSGVRESKGFVTVVDSGSLEMSFPANRAATAESGRPPATDENRRPQATDENRRPPANDENRRRLQPLLPWEEMVDQLSDCQSYMELAGQHSGLGRLFINNQKLILEIFKRHIRLYDKGSGLLFPEDVKRYFSNYIAAGSVTCRSLRENLLKEIQKTADKGGNRFESVVDGRRTYLGHLIPADAPPRPDGAAVWDDVKKRWVH